MGGGVPGAQAAPQSAGNDISTQVMPQSGTGKYGGMANQGGGANPFQQFQQAAGQGVNNSYYPQTQQMPPGNSYYPQTQPQQQVNPGTGKFGGMANQQANQQQPFQQQGGQPNYSALLRSIAGMFGQQGGAPVNNYNPVQSANDFQLRNTYQFNSATDPSRQLADKMWAENHQRELDERAAREARAARGESYGYGMGDSTGGAGGAGGGAASGDAGGAASSGEGAGAGGAPGDAGGSSSGTGGDGGAGSGTGNGARGGRMLASNKQIRAALLTAKGVQAKAVPGKSEGGDVAPGAPITAYHTTYEPFKEYDWSKLGEGTKVNSTDDDPDSWAMTLARIGPWAHQYPLNKEMGYGTSMPVSISGKGKAFGSLDSLHAAVKKTGGVEPFRKSLLTKGFEHVVVKDEEFGKNKSYVALHPGAFTIKPAGDAPGKGGGGEVEGEAEPQPQFSVSNPMPVFPKPQRMWDDQRPGGAYLSMPDKADVTGHRAAQAEIGVNPGGKPFFNASRDAVEATGTPGRGSATVKTNLFKKKAGWQWAQAPEGHEATDTIVSVDHRGKHHYALNVQFPKGVDLSRYEKATSEPRLRPTTKGNLEFGEQAGTILVRGKEHPVYHNVTVRSLGGRVGYAGGGGEDDPTVQKALGLTQGVQPTAPQMARRLNDQGLYSHAAEAAAALPQAKGSPQQMLAMLSARGVKPDELKYSGAQNAFGGQKAVTKDELAQHFEQNVPEIQETVLRKNQAKYREHQLPGSGGTIDQKAKNDWLNEWAAEAAVNTDDISHAKEWKNASEEIKSWHLEEAEKAFNEKAHHDEAFINQFKSPAKKAEKYREILLHTPEKKDNLDSIAQRMFGKNYRDLPYEQSRLVTSDPTASLGFNYTQSHWNVPNVLGHIRASDRDKGKTLHVEELQSDWGQDKRKGKGVPDHPLVGSTNAWTDLLLKRALREAASGEYDRMAWTPGEEQLKRFKNEGLVNYYDKIVPQRLTEIVKKLGHKAEITPHFIDTAEGEKSLHSIRMTPELRASIMRGLPVYKAGGRIGYANGGGNNSVVR